MNLMYNALLHAHSGLRWVALLLLLWAIANAVRSQRSGTYEKKDRLINLFSMVMLHIQLLIGLALYFINARSKVVYAEGWMGESVYRFYGLEHIAGMIIAITVVTLGRRKAESLTNTRDKHRKVAAYYTIGLIIILLSIPWPFRQALGGAWF